MHLEEYSEKSFVIRGENSKEYKERLKELGGKWNANLKDGGGWIFSIKHKDVVEKWLEDLDTNKIIDLHIIDYSEKSFVVRGDSTKDYKERLKELGGKWNANLKDGGGWIFSNNNREKVNDWITAL
jgi:hypothetical protein